MWGVTPALSRVLNPSGVSFGKGQVPVSGLVPQGASSCSSGMELSVDRHTGACLFLQLLNGFIGNLPGAGRGFGWVLAALLGCSELAGAFLCDTEFSMEQQREKLHILL